MPVTHHGNAEAVRYIRSLRTMTSVQAGAPRRRSWYRQTHALRSREPYCEGLAAA